MCTMYTVHARLVFENVFFVSSNVNEGEAAPVQKGHGTNVYLEFTEFSR